MNCPNFSNESVKTDFNKIVTMLGGSPITMEEFMSPALRNSRLADDYNAMERAYELWDRYEGDMAKIQQNLGNSYIDNINPTTKIGMEADSMSVFDMLIKKMQTALPGIQVNWVAKSQVPMEYQNQPAYRIGTDIYFVEENITLDSPMHEFGHLWIDIIELSDQELYNEIMTGIDGMISNNNPIAIAVKNNGQNLAETALRKEIFSKMMGFTSIGKIRNYAKENNVQINDNILSRTAEFIKNVMQRVGNLISKIFFNNVNVQMSDTVDNVIEKLIDEVIYGAGENTVVKEGVSELFESNPELTSLGTPEQYSQYLNTIFPDSKVKDIVYHGTRYDFDSFKGFDFDFFFAKSVELSEHVAKYSSRGTSNPRIIKALLNANKIWNYEIEGGGQEISSIHFYRLIEEGYDTVINEREIAVRKPEQIHILGSKQDIEGFKKFANSNKQSKTLVPSDIKEELEIIKNRKETNFNFQPIANVSSIHNLLLGSESTIYENLTDEEYAKNLFVLNVKPDRNGNSSFIYGPLYFELNGTTQDEIIREIKNDIIPQIKEFDANFPQKFAKYVMDVSTNGVDPEEAGQDLYPKANINRGYFQTLYNGLNLFDAVEGVYTFDQIRNASNPAIRALSSNLVEGNYVVIVHKVDGKDVEATLVDITPDQRNNVVDKYRNKKNAFKNFIKSDAKASTMGVTLKHSVLTSRQITNGFIAKSMTMSAKSNGYNVSFRGFGILGRVGSEHTYIQVADINELGDNMNVLKDVPEFLDMLGTEVKNIVTADEEIAPMQSSIDKLVRFLEAKRHTTTGRLNESKEDIETLRNGTPSDKRYILTKLMSKISKVDQNDTEYRLLSLALAEYHLSQYTTSNRLDDMSGMSSKFMNPHNFQSDLLQIFNKEYIVAKGIVVDDCVKWQKSANVYVKEIIKKRTDLAVRSRVQDMGSKIFEHLYKKVKATDENGKEIEITVPGEIHWAKNKGTKNAPSWEFFDNNTRNLYNQGVLDDNDLLYTEMILDQVEDLYTKAEYEKNKYEKVRDATGIWQPYSMEDARRNVQATIKRGFVPVMDKTANEMLFTGNPKDAAKRLVDNISNPNVIFEDLIDRGKEMEQIKSAFSNQLKMETRLANYGIAIKNGEYVIDNRVLYNKMATNVDRTMAVFTLAENRAVNYSDRLVPLRNSINTIFKVYEDLGKDQTYNEQAMKYLTNMLLDQKVENSKEWKGKFAKFVDSSGVMLTFAHIFMKTSLFVKSVVWNNVRDIIVSGSNSIAANGNYNSVDWIKAQGQVAKNANFVYTLARDLQIIDRSEWDMVSNPLLVKSDRNFFQTWFGFLPNYMSDSHSRIVTMVAQMIHDGTWKAYSFDKDTGNWSYDETLDTRMYDENGTITDEGKVLKEAIKTDLVDQGLMKKEDEKLTRGYDYQDAARLKYLSDKYVIGSFDQHTKTLGAQNSLMRMMMKFRIFSTDRVQNAGLFMDTRKSIAEGKRTVYKDKEGNIVSKREMAEIEGAWQSWGKAVKLLLALRSKANTKKAWSDMSKSTKTNMARTLLQLVTWYALRGAILGFKGTGDDKEEKKRREYLIRQWSWVYGDIMVVNIITDFYKNPVPIIDNIVSFGKATEKLCKGGGVSKELFNFMPGSGIWKDYDYFKSIADGQEVYYEKKKAEAKETRKWNKERKEEK